MDRAHDSEEKLNAEERRHTRDAVRVRCDPAHALQDGCFLQKRNPGPQEGGREDPQLPAEPQTE